MNKRVRSTGGQAIKSEKNTRKSAKQCENNIANNIKENPNKYWSYVGKKWKVRFGLRDLQKNDGSLTQNNKEKTILWWTTSHLFFFYRNK